MARASVSAVDDVLDGKVVLGPSTLGHESQTISDGGSGRERPAGTAPHGDVLVLVDTHHVDTVDVTATLEHKSQWIRVELLGELLRRQVVLRLRSLDVVGNSHLRTEASFGTDDCQNH